MLGPLLEVEMSKKGAHRCGAKHISKSKVQKTVGYGALLDVQMPFCVAGARDYAPCQSEQNFRDLQHFQKRRQARDI